MAAPETKTTDEVKKIDLSSLPEKANVHIHMGSDEPVFEGKPVKSEMSKRGLYAIVSGSVGAVLGYIASKVYINQKMFDFETEVLGQTKGNILGRTGLGASIAESGLGGTGLAAGFSSGEIHMANAAKLAQSGKYGSFPKFIYKTLGGPEGKSIMMLGGAAVAGTLAAAAAYSMTKPDKRAEREQDAGKDWAEKVAADKNAPRELS